MNLVFILIDALSSRYLTAENMPFLYKLKEQGLYIQEIEPSPGFCERSEIFSGLNGFSTRNFSAIGYLPSLSPYRKYKPVLKLFTILENLNARIARHAFNKLRLLRKIGLNIYRIPLRSLSNFCLTEDGPIQLKKYSDIFNRLAENHLSYTMDAFTSLSDLTLRSQLNCEEFVESEIDKHTNFIPYYIGVIDSVGHRFGNDINSIRPYLQEVDSQIEVVYKMADRNQYSLAILGDHGMVPVTHNVNVMKSVNALKLKHGSDYEVFYDSTSVRFWFYNDKASKLIIDLFKSEFNSYGIIVDNNNCKELEIPFDTQHEGVNVYGDFLWCANPGVLISPDYFHADSNSCKGMHGYYKQPDKSGMGLFVAVGSNIYPMLVEREKLSSVCSYMCSFLNIKTPNE